MMQGIRYRVAAEATTDRIIRTALVLFAILQAIACGGCGIADANNTNDNNNNITCQEPPVCGDMILLCGEECEFNMLGGHTCESLGWEGGTLSCSPECKFDVSQCTGSNPCGNGVIDYGEQCDGDNIDGHDCQSVYSIYIGGAIACRPDCRWSALQCELGPTCGDGERKMTDGEICDDGESNSDVLPDACRTNCIPARCNDGVVDTGEICDDGLFNSNILPDACRGDCKPARCGDGTKDSSELCDGYDLGGYTCTDLGFVSGDIACLPDCSYDTADCQ